VTGILHPPPEVLLNSLLAKSFLNAPSLLLSSTNATGFVCIMPILPDRWATTNWRSHGRGEVEIWSFMISLTKVLLRFFGVQREGFYPKHAAYSLPCFPLNEVFCFHDHLSFKTVKPPAVVSISKPGRGAGVTSRSLRQCAPHQNSFPRKPQNTRPGAIVTL